MLNNFFVYGTLMQGMSNHGIIIADAIEKIESAKVERMDLYMHKGSSFPCMVKGTGTVYGELITIKPEYLELTMKFLDRLEGYYGPKNNMNLYHRTKGFCETSEGSLVECNMYLYNENRKGLGEIINDGDFRNHFDRGELS